MLKRAFILFGPMIVFIFGFVSCSSDSEVVYRPDSFTMDGVSVQNEDQSILKGRLATELSPEKILTLDKYQNHDFATNPLEITVFSKCAIPRAPFTVESTTVFHNVESIPVVQILPEDVLLTVIDEPILCDFSLTGKNRLTSTDRTDLPNVRIDLKKLLEFSNLELPYVDLANVQYTIDKGTAVQAVSAHPIQLRCEDISLVRGIDHPYFSLEEFQLERPEVLSQLSKAGQRCRFLVKNPEAPQVSAVFTVQFPIATPRLKLTIPSLGRSHILDHSQVFSAEIINPNPLPIVVRIENVGVSALTFRPVYFSREQMYLGHPRRQGLVFSEIQNALTRNQDGHLLITIAAHQTASWTATLAGSYSCANGNALPPIYAAPMSSPTAGIRLYYIGLNYRIEIGTDRYLDILGATDPGLEVTLNQNSHPQSPELPLWDIYSLDVLKHTPKGWTSRITDNQSALLFYPWAVNYDDCREF